MKLLVIGTDASMFDPATEARRRIEAYCALFDELHVIICTPPGFSETADRNPHLHPTNSRARIFAPFDAARIGRRITQERAIDLISVQDPAESGLAGWLLKRRTGLPLHIQLHTDIFSLHFRRNSWKERVRYAVACFILRRGDAFRVVSARLRDSLNSKFQIPNSKITMLPIFVDREAIAHARPAFNLHERYRAFDFIIIMVSRLNRDKRIDVALDAFAAHRRAFPRTGLVIVGDGPERQNLESRARNLALTGSVRFEGWEGNAENLASYYKTADLYLLTSAFEGYGRTVIEAAAAGLPIIMTDVGVARDIIREGETGRVVPVGDRETLVRALIDARRNQSRMRAMADCARREVLALSPRTWEEYLEQYRESYENFLRH